MNGRATSQLERTVTRWILRGELGALAAGRAWIVPVAELELFLAERTRARLGRHVEPEYAVPVRP